MPGYIEQTAYSFFGVAPTAGVRRLLQKFPVDRVWDTPMGSVAKTGRQEVDRWYALIGTVEARAAYDKALAEKRRSTTTYDSGEPSNAKEDAFDSVPGGTSSNGPMSTDAESTSGPQDDDGTSQTTGSGVFHGEEDGADKMEAEDEAEVSGDETCDAIPAITDDVLADAAPAEPPFEDKSVPLPEETSLVTAVPPKRRITVRHILCAFSIAAITLLTLARLPCVRVNHRGASPYATLGLSEDYTLGALALRNAYHRTVLLHHPDKQRRSTPPDDPDAMFAIFAAYALLADPHQRCLYETRQQTQWWDWTGRYPWYTCAHLAGAESELVLTTSVEPDDERDAAVVTANQRAVARYQPAQLAVYQKLQGWLQVARQKAWIVAGWFLEWLKQA